MELKILRKLHIVLASALYSAMTTYVGLSHADIAIDGGTATTVDAVGGAEVVNIATPSASGVSRNTFSRFDVGSGGAVLNNSRVDGTSLLAGDLAANPNLAGGSARIILNEVTSNRRSELFGTTELFGDNARYILANPNGITCDGCGFIRTPTAAGDFGTRIQEVLLGTGTPLLDAGTGAILSMRIDGNNTAQLIIGSGGLDTSNVDVTTLLTRRASIDGLINAVNGQLNMYVGEGRLDGVDSGTYVWETSTDAHAPLGVAIDASAAGAMHAGRIFIQATEEGAGVSLPDNLLSSSDIEITAAGDLVYRNAQSQTGNIAVTVTRAGSGISSGGQTIAAGDIELSADGDIGAAELVSGVGASIHSVSGDVNVSRIEAGSDVVVSAGDDIAYGTVISHAGSVLVENTAAHGDIEISGNTSAARDVTLTIGGTATVASGGGTFSAGEDITIRCVEGDDACGVHGQRSLTLSARNLYTQADIVTSAGRDLSINANLDSAHVFSSGGVLRIAATDDDIRSTGSLLASGDIELVAAAGAQILLDGNLVTGANLYLQGDGTYVHDGIGSQQIAGDRHIDMYGVVNSAILSDLGGGLLRVNRLDNSGLIENQAALILQVDDVLNNSGIIASLEGAVDVGGRAAGSSTSEVNNSGIIAAIDMTQNQLGPEGMILDPSDLIREHTNAILAGEQRSAADLTRRIKEANALLIAELNLNSPVTGVLTIRADRLNNSADGRINGSDVHLEVGSASNSGGQLLAGRNLSIDGTALDNSSTDTRIGFIGAGQLLDIDLAGRLDNSGLMEANTVRISASQIDNHGSIDGVGIDAMDAVDMAPYTDELAGQLWFASGGDDIYQHTLRRLYDNDVIESDPARLTNAFLDSTGIALGPKDKLVGDDIYMSELVMRALRDQVGLSVIHTERDGLRQLAKLYGNTKAYMDKTGVEFGQIPTGMQLAVLKSPIVVFAEQALPDGGRLYVPRLLFPAQGSDLVQRADDLSARIAAQADLLLQGGSVSVRDAELFAGDSLIIEAVDLNIKERKRDWYVDANGQVQYRTARMEAGGDVIVQLSGNYVQNGGQVLAGNQVVVQAQAIDIANKAPSPAAAAARLSGKASPWQGLMGLASARHASGDSEAPSSGGLAEARGTSANIYGGSVLLVSSKDMNLDRADIRASKALAGGDGSLTLISDQGSIIQTAGNLGGESILMQAANDVVTQSIIQVRNHRSDYETPRPQLLWLGFDGETTHEYRSRSVRSQTVSIDSATLDAGEGGIIQIAGGDIENSGTSLRSAGSILQQADGNIANRSIAQRYLKKQVDENVGVWSGYTQIATHSSSRVEHDVAAQQVTLIAEGDILQYSGGDIQNLGASMRSGGNIIQYAKSSINNSTLVADGSEVSRSQSFGTQTSSEPVEGIFPLGGMWLREERNRETVNTRIVRRDLVNSLEADGDIVAQVEDGDYRNTGNIAAGGDVVIAARDILNRRLTAGEGNDRVVLNTGKVSAGGDIMLSAERDIRDVAGRYEASGDILLQAQGDIRQDAIRIRKDTHETSRIGWFMLGTKDTTRIQHTTGSFTSGGVTSLAAEGDLSLSATGISAQDIELRGKDVTLEALSNLRQTTKYDGAYTVNREVDHDVVRLASRGNLIIQAEDDLVTRGSVLKARGGEESNIVLNAGGDMRLLGVNDENYSYYKKTDSGFFSSKTTIRESRRVTLRETQLLSEGNILVNVTSDEEGRLAGRDSGRVILEGTRMDAGQDAMLYAGENLNVLSGIEYSYNRSETHKSSFGGLFSSGSVAQQQARRLGHAEITSGGDTLLLSGGDINVVAGVIRAENIIADAGFQTDREREASINIIGEKEALSAFKHSYESGLSFRLEDKFFSIAEETHDRRWDTKETYIGSNLQAADSILLRANTDINIIGSRLNASGSLAAQAGRDLNILGGVSRIAEKHEYETTRLGIGYDSTGNGFEIFAGAETKRAGESRDQMLSAGLQAGEGDTALTGSQLLAANISLQADQDIVLAGADIATWQLAAPETGERTLHDDFGHIDIRAGRDVHTLASVDEDAMAEYEERLRVGFKLSVQENVSSAGSATKKAKDEGGVANGLRAVDAIQGARSSSVDASLAIVGEYDRSESGTVQRAVRPTQLQAAGDLTIAAGRDQRHQGTQAYAGGDLTLDAGRHLTIESAQQSSGQSSETLSIGVAYGIGNKKAGVSASLGASEYDQENIAQVNARFSAGGATVLRSGGDTTVAGAVIRGETLKADIGGDLTLASRQDSGEIRGWSGNVSGSTSGSFSLSASRTRGDTDWVGEQTALLSSGKMDIDVGGHTELTGALINSDSGELRLSTDTLAFSDLHDSDSYEYIAFSVGVQTSQSCSAAGGSGCGAGNTGRQTRVNSLDAQYQSRDRAQLTRATVGEGTVLVRRDGETGTDSTAGLNRDLSLAQQLIRDDATDYDLYYSDSSVTTVTNTFTGQGADLIDTLRPDLIVAEVTGSAILGLNDIDNAFHDALTLNLSGDPAQNRGLLDDGRTAALSKSVESRIKAGTSGLQLYQTKTGEWRFIGQDTTYDERYAEHMGGRALSDTARINERAINNITDDSDGSQTHTVLQEVVRQAAGTSDTRLVLFDDETTSLAAGAKGYYSEQHNQAGLNVAAVDMANPREVMETVAHEGRHGQTTGSSDSEEALATLYGRETGYQWARSNQREGSHVGGYNGNSSEEWRQNAGVTHLVSQGNAQTAQVHPAQMDFRQFNYQEAKLLDRARVNIGQLNISTKAKDYLAYSLDAAACAEVRCAAQIPPEDPKYETFKRLQDAGDALGEGKFAELMAQLDVDTTYAVAVTGQARRNGGTRTVQGFEYGVTDRMEDATQAALGDEVEAAQQYIHGGYEFAVFALAETVAKTGNENAQGFAEYMAEQVDTTWTDAETSSIGLTTSNSFQAATWQPDQNIMAELAMVGIELVPAAKPVKAVADVGETLLKSGRRIPDATSAVDDIGDVVPDSTVASTRQSGFVFRGDGRSPDVIFEQGLQPRGTNQDLLKYAQQNEPSVFVSTSKSPNVAREFADMQGDGFVYTIRGQADGVDVNAVLGAKSPFPHELEIAVPGGVKPTDIMGARQVGPDGRFIGPFIKNPTYGSR
ncbi:MAG: hemagglutinin repeat-containing protein [Candidatus Zixiibacteriota bacterium]